MTSQFCEFNVVSATLNQNIYVKQVHIPNIDTRCYKTKEHF